MTKTLTEQWKDDTLTDGYYYTKKITYPETYPSCDEHIIESIDLYSCDYGFDDDMDICEVLAPVPSYEEWKGLDDELKELATKNDTLAMDNGELKDHCNALINLTKDLDKQLAIATRALKYYDGLENIIIDWKLLTGQEAGTARKALKEMEGVK